MRGARGDRPRTWPRSGALVVSELTVSLGTCGELGALLLL